MAAREAMMSVSCGPMKLETRNWKSGEGSSADEDGRPDLDERGESAGDEDQIGRQMKSEIGAQMRPTLAAELVERQAGDSGERDDRDADGAEGDRRGVREQADG